MCTYMYTTSSLLMDSSITLPHTIQWLSSHLINVLLSGPRERARIVAAQYEQWVVIDMAAWGIYHGEQQIVTAIRQLVGQVQQVEGYVVALWWEETSHSTCVT